VSRANELSESPFLGGGIYRIRVAGAVDEDWLQHGTTMKLTVRSTPVGHRVTELLGVLPDSAALMGLLDLLYNHGARLLSVEYLEDDSGGVAPEGRIQKKQS
jgi:hypothetical protein